MDSVLSEIRDQHSATLQELSRLAKLLGSGISQIPERSEMTGGPQQEDIVVFKMPTAPFQLCFPERSDIVSEESNVAEGEPPKSVSSATPDCPSTVIEEEKVKEECVER